MNYLFLSALALSLTPLAAPPAYPNPTADPTRSSDEKATLFMFDMGEGYLSGMSDNGLWGVYKMPDFSEVDAFPRRMNLRTGEMETLPLVDSQYPPHVCKPFDITDDGNFIYGGFDDLPAYYSAADQQWHDLDLLFRPRGYSGAVYSVTPDGSWAVGWLMSSMTSFRPALWHENQPVELGELPDYDIMLEKGIIDQEDYDDHKTKGQTPNIAFWKISSDGKHVLASTDHNYPGWGCAYFVYHTETSTYDWIEDPAMPLHCHTSGASMSDNGEWISASWTGTRVNPDGSWDDVHKGFRYHLPDGKVDYQSGGGHIGNDGLYSGLSVNLDGTRISYETIMRQVFGLDIKSLTGYDSFGNLFFVSTDRKTIMTQPGYRTTAFSASVPIPFDEAALQVNLLSESRVAPDPGAVLSRLESLTISFDTRAKVSDDLKGLVMRGDEPVAESASITSADQRTFTISFPGLVLDAGVTYDVVLPEALFYSADGRHSSPRAVISYKGRPDTPLSPLRITPSEGSSLPELSTYSMVILDFDTRPVPVPDMEALLYEEGSDRPLASMTIVADDSRVGLYPAVARRLAKGKEYRVVVPAGSFTDIAGNCPNEELSICYSGSYVLQTPEVDGNLLFFDDFSNPNQSLSNFLQYEGDHLTPTDEMAAWGFDNDNTPWNFSIRDDAEYDYCAAATSSCKEPDGVADDWMLLPRLTISNPSNFLTFKAQSFRASADDRLRIYVWESDDYFGQLDDAIMGRLKEEAQLVFDTRLSPGRFENTLAGDWIQYEVSLAQFEGKNIYIAFANQNDHASAVFVDDIAVEYRGNYTLSSRVPSSVIGNEPLEISCSVKVNNDVNYDKLTARCVHSGSGSESLFSASGLGLSKGDSYSFSFPEPFLLTPGEYNQLTVTVSLDGETQAIPLSVANPLFEADRCVLVEEGTGEWCGYCPSGFVALDYLQKSYPGKVAEVSIHHDDTYAFESYVAFLGFQGYPSGRIDRTPFLCMPLAVNSSTGLLSLTSQSGAETFADFVEQRLALPPLASFSIRECTFDQDLRRINARLEVVPTMNFDDADWNLFSVITEYDLPARQDNNYSGSSDPLMAEWSERSNRVSCEIPAVARAIGSPSFYGDSGLLPRKLKAGERYPLELVLNLPDNVLDPAKCRLVVALVSNNDGTVINAATAGYGVDPSSVEEHFADSARSFFRMSGGKILCNGSAEGVRLHDLQGRSVSNSGLDRLPAGTLLIANCGPARSLLRL